MTDERARGPQRGRHLVELLNLGEQALAVLLKDGRRVELRLAVLRA